ncbi:MAG: dihydropteroate synthase [Acidobacteria bacterium]|nr:dihydropteroate synthase [Acidobacteriota bacterium]
MKRTLHRIPLVKRYEMTLGARTQIVGVLNITPDSFSDGGQYNDPASALDRALEMQAQGADLVEIGGESTRPNATPVPVEAELSRVLPVLKALQGKLTIPISVDTYKSEVARQALDCGASLINDVSALRFDETLAASVAKAGAGLILMHMRGTPATMQKMAPSAELFAEINREMNLAIEKALAYGVPHDRLIFDPGIGFGKTLEQNLAILNHLERFAELHLPIMIGTSRKSFIGKLTGQVVSERIWGTAASVALAIARGAHLVRVHDVKEMKEVAAVADAIIQTR